MTFVAVLLLNKLCCGNIFTYYFLKRTYCVIYKQIDRHTLMYTHIYIYIIFLFLLVQRGKKLNILKQIGAQRDLYFFWIIKFALYLFYSNMFQASYCLQRALMILADVYNCQLAKNTQIQIICPSIDPLTHTYIPID